MKNFLGHEVEWFWCMKKIAPPFGMSAFQYGPKLIFKYWEYPTNLLSHWYHYEDIYADKEECETIKKFIYYLIEKDSSYPDRMVEKISSLAKEIYNQKIIFDNSLSLKELLKIFEKESYLFLKMVGILSYRGPIPIADILNEKVLSVLIFKLAERNKLNEYNKYKEIIQTPSKKSFVLEEQEFISENKDRLESDKEDVLKEYRSRFDFLQFHWLVGKNLSDEEILERFSQPITKPLVNRNTVLEDLFNEDEMKIVYQLQDWIYLRTYIKDTVNFAGYKLLPLLDLVAKKKGIPAEYMPYFMYEEILDFENLNVGELEKRYKERVNGYSAQIINGKMAIGDFGKPPEIVEDFEVLKGNVAYSGFVKGKVKVMKNPRDDFEDADVLVVGMTTPDYLPVMKKAKAFVTDEGGITCHAAIVAREMKKPCVIGTKIATKVLKDGDEVEVDADEGIVRRLG